MEENLLHKQIIAMRQVIELDSSTTQAYMLMDIIKELDVDIAKEIAIDNDMDEFEDDYFD